MKKLAVIVFVALLGVVVSGIVVGEEATPVKPDSKAPAPRPGRLSPEHPGIPDATRKPGVNLSREKFVENKIKEMTSELDRKASAHKDFVGQLEEIKKIATSENATKTAGKIQELIDKENSKFENEQTEANKKMEAFKTRMEESLQRAPGTQRGAGLRPPTKGLDIRGRKPAGQPPQKAGDTGETKKE